MLVYSAIAYTDNINSPSFNGDNPAAFYYYKKNGDFRINNSIQPPFINEKLGLNSSQDINYYGAFRYSELANPARNDLNMGSQAMAWNNNLSQTKIQRNVTRQPAAWNLEPLLWIGKLASNKMPGVPKFRFENEWQGIQYNLTSQWHRSQKRDYPGSYLTLHDKKLMVSWGSDGKHWRSSFGYVAPDQGDEHLRPSVEGFYMDNSIGKINGGKDLMVTGSLGFGKGLFGNKSRQGRITEPSGTGFVNVLNGWNPDPNRRLTAWEKGEFVDFRFLHKSQANGRREKTLETAIYPGQLFGTKSQLDTLFVGFGVTTKHPEKDGISALFGYHQRLGNFSSSARIQHDFDRSNTSLIVSLNHRL